MWCEVDGKDGRASEALEPSLRYSNLLGKLKHFLAETLGRYLAVLFLALDTNC